MFLNSVLMKGLTNASVKHNCTEKHAFWKTKTHPHISKYVTAHMCFIY